LKLPKTMDNVQNSSHFYCNILKPEKIRITLEKKHVTLSVFQRPKSFLSFSAAEKINLHVVACQFTRGRDRYDAHICEL
jgi:hypothetical protein